MRDFRIAYGGLCIRFTSAFSIAVPEELKPFLTSEGAVTDRYEICLPSEPAVPRGELLCRRADLTAYRNAEGTVQIYHPHGGSACHIRTDGCHSLYVTEKLAETMADGSRLAGILNMEEILLRHDGILLHSSVVCHEGRAVLFSGPCGIGKSTQAELWHRVFGDKIINGDRTVIRRTEAGFYAGGSPWSGSSKIYCKDFIPLEGIVLLRQGKENAMTPADSRTAFREIYSQCLVHSWDRAYVDRVCALIADLMGKVRVYTLTCVPEPSAAALAEGILFPK